MLHAEVTDRELSLAHKMGLQTLTANCQVDDVIRILIYKNLWSLNMLLGVKGMSKLLCHYETVVDLQSFPNECIFLFAFHKD